MSTVSVYLKIAATCAVLLGVALRIVLPWLLRSPRKRRWVFLFSPPSLQTSKMRSAVSLGFVGVLLYIIFVIWFIWSWSDFSGTVDVQLPIAILIAASAFCLAGIVLYLLDRVLAR